MTTVSYSLIFLMFSINLFSKKITLCAFITFSVFASINRYPFIFLQYPININFCVFASPICLASPWGCAPVPRSQILLNVVDHFVFLSMFRPEFSLLLLLTEICLLSRLLLKWLLPNIF